MYPERHEPSMKRHLSDLGSIPHSIITITVTIIII